MKDYEDLKRIFHQSNSQAKALYNQRFNSKDAVRIPLSINGCPAFYVMDSTIYKLVLEAERLDRDIQSYQSKLPDSAIEQYLMRSLIDEIVLTNEIEGVHSSRQEIGDVLDRLSKNDKHGRFQGIVDKYLALVSMNTIPFDTCEDIRSLYNDLVLSEVLRENPNNAPDGVLFRKNATHVIDQTGRTIHDGIEPESKIIELMEHALGLLKNESVEALVRVSLFHFMFSFIHPFYDGNGRTNRFISSYVLAHAFSPLPGLRLSYAIKENIRDYYKAFSLCEHPLNKGELTPFVIAFAQIVVKAMRSMRDSLKEKNDSLSHYVTLSEAALNTLDADAKTKEVAELLIQAALFSESGISASEIATAIGSSVPTVYNKLKIIDGLELVAKEKKGRSSYLSLDLNKLEALQTI